MISEKYNLKIAQQIYKLMGGTPIGDAIINEFLAAEMDTAQAEVVADLVHRFVMYCEAVEQQ